MSLRWPKLDAPHRFWRWLSGHPWVTSLVTVAIVVGAAGWVVTDQAAERAAFAACVARWGDAITSRSAALGVARREVDEANDTLWRTMAALLAQPQPDAPIVFGRERARYIAASDTYQASLERNAAPLPPTLACG